MQKIRVEGWGLFVGQILPKNGADSTQDLKGSTARQNRRKRKKYATLPKCLECIGPKTDFLFVGQFTSTSG
jgi:hypothetical protein